jgi:translation elongation factor EF-Tu-like GTPase
MYNNMKQEQIIIIGVGIASMLFAYLLKGNILEGIGDKPDYSELLMVREQVYQLIKASSLLNENAKIPIIKRTTAKENIDSVSEQLLTWYKNRVKGLANPPDTKTTIAELKKTWSENKPLITSSEDILNVSDKEQAIIGRLLRAVITNMDAIE